MKPSVMFTHYQAGGQTAMATRKSKSTTKRAPTVTLSALVNTIAERNGVESTKQGKAVRRHIRAHYDDLAKRWPALADAKQNRDGNRYPPMPRKVADEITERFVKS